MRELLNKIVCGDCIEILGKIGEPFADLIFADPPFNIGYKYDKYRDKVDGREYVAWTERWMRACKNVLKPHGSFYIAIGDEYAADVKKIADKLELVMRNWIIWHYTFGQQLKRKFARSHTHILYFVNDEKNFIFNDVAVRVISDRQKKYQDKRANPAHELPLPDAGEPAGADHKGQLQPGPVGTRPVQRLGNHRGGRTQARTQVHRNRNLARVRRRIPATRRGIREVPGRR